MCRSSVSAVCLLPCVRWWGWWCWLPGAAAAGTGPLLAAAERPDLTVAAVPAAGATGLYIAAQDGYFTAAGLHVKIVPIASGSDALADLINGSVDVVEGQWTSDIAAEAAGIAKLHALAAGNTGAPGVEEVTVAPGSPISTVKQLARQDDRGQRAGRPVAVPGAERAGGQRGGHGVRAFHRGAVPGHGRRAGRAAGGCGVPD